VVILRLQEQIFFGKLLKVGGYTIWVSQIDILEWSKSEMNRKALEEA